MEISGHIQNGVVVLDGPETLAEGTPVTVLVTMSPKPSDNAKGRKRLEFPLIPSSAPGSVHLTNERIHELLEEEELESLKGVGNVSS